jgi:hypothetical protein
MRYNELFESNYKKIEYEDLEQYRDIIKEYIKSPAKLYRGMIASSSYIFGNSHIEKRKSTFGPNYIAMLSTFLPSWKGWPARTNSFICSTDIKYTYDFGFPYYVIPLNVDTFAVANRDDFNFTKINTHEFNSFIAHIMRASFDNGEPVYDTKAQYDPKVFIECIEQFINNTKNLNDHELIHLLNDKKNIFTEEVHKMREIGVTKWLDERISPTRSGELIHDFDKLDYFSKESREVWFEGNALFIHKDMWQSVKSLF